MEDKKVYVLRGFYGERLEQRATLITAEDGSAIHDKALAIDRARHISKGSRLVEGLIHEIDASKAEDYELEDLTESSVVDMILRECFFSDEEHRWVYVGRELEKPGKGYVVVASNGRVLGLGWTEEEAYADAWNNCEYEEEWTDSDDQRDTLNEDYAIDVMRASKDAMKAIEEGEVYLKCTDVLIIRATGMNEYDIYMKDEYIKALVNNKDAWASHWSY